jgi:diadenosine tetraphosphatase ApaH/serine/threonine PP2A family protein phosphatase
LICCIGHTHVPLIWSSRGRIQRVAHDEQAIINVGSIGQPRDRNTELSFGVFDTDQWTYENIRSPYDMETAARKILNTPLPQRLGLRLFMGI